MPGRGLSKTTAGRRAGRRRAAERDTDDSWKSEEFRGTMLVYPGVGFPQRYRCKLKYADDQEFIVPPSILQTSTFNFAGMYDPNTTGGGHQPVFFDNLHQIYNHNVVCRAYIEYTLMCIEGSCKVVSYVDDDATPATVFNQAVEQKRGKVEELQIGTPALRVRQTYVAAEIFSKEFRAKDSLQGTVGSNPAEGFYAIFSVQSYGGLQCKLMMNCTIIFDAEFYELKTQPIN